MTTQPDSPLTPNPPGGPRLNALKHGFYSEQILLPGDNAAEFARRRVAFFERHRPQTECEAECIEIMAECRWGWMRGRTNQAQFDAETRAPATDDTGRVSEPLAHQRFHSTMDGTVHRQRLQRMWYRADSRLRLLQRERRLGLIAGAVKLPEGCYMDSSGEIVGPVVPPVIVPRTELPLNTPIEAPKPAPVAAAVEVVERRLAPVVHSDNVPASALDDKRFENFTEQKENGVMVPTETHAQPESPHATPHNMPSRDANVQRDTPARIFLRLADEPGEMTVHEIRRPTRTDVARDEAPAPALTDLSSGTLPPALYTDMEAEDADWLGGTVTRFQLQPSGLAGGLAGGLDAGTQVGSAW